MAHMKSNNNDSSTRNYAEMEEGYRKNVLPSILAMERNRGRSPEQFPDHAQFLEYLEECPMRIIGSFVQKNGTETKEKEASSNSSDLHNGPRREQVVCTYSICCDLCGRHFCFPYALVFHCGQCLNGRFDACWDCFEKAFQEHYQHEEIDVNYMAVIFHRYYVDESRKDVEKVHYVVPHWMQQ
jgi:hypothetical protein